VQGLIRGLGTVSLILSILAFPTGFAYAISRGSLTYRYVTGAALTTGFAAASLVFAFLAWRVSRHCGMPTLGCSVRAGRAISICLLCLSPVGFSGARQVEDLVHVERCRTHVKLLLRALELYVGDNDGRYPVSATWCDALLPYVGNKKRLVCPEAPDLRCGYAYNASLSAADATAVTPDTGRANALVVFFESDVGWNARGGPGILPEKPRHYSSGADIYGLAGSNVVSGSRSRHERLSDGTEVWSRQPSQEGLRWGP